MKDAKVPYATGVLFHLEVFESDRFVGPFVVHAFVNV